MASDFAGLRGRETRERVLATGIALLLFGYGGAWIAQRFAGILSARHPVHLQLAAYLPQNGGWVGEPLEAVSGQPIRLHITGMEGAHALAIGHTEIRSNMILAGQKEILHFSAPAAGRYVIYCTLWCGPDHWRMRTVLEVAHLAAPDGVSGYMQDELRYPIAAGLALDDPHPAAVWPARSPSAATGADLWRRLDLPELSGPALEELNWPFSTPAQVAQRMAQGDPLWLAAAGERSAEDRWALTAYLWRSASSHQTRRLGADLYDQNCAACHGNSGRGDGPGASTTSGTEPDLADAAYAAGASPALYYAKIARGGMGTGMPNWGTILTEDQLWAATDHLFTFLFDYGP